MIEIGSEFWLTEEEKSTPYDPIIPVGLELGEDNRFLLSGRTAIDYVLRDILKDREIKTVYFPSYCCESMLQPFVDKDIQVIFYDVCYESELTFNINTSQECDIFFAMNYFGFSKGRMDGYIDLFKQKNAIVIEDSTHSILSTHSHNRKSDYIVASLRKWFSLLSGGLAVKIHGKFRVEGENGSLTEMVKIKKLAMLEKGKYINGDNSINKTEFLEKYSTANRMLKDNYSLYGIDQESHQILQEIDLKNIVNIRKKNSDILYRDLLKSKKVTMLFPKLEDADCPLFVPIILGSDRERNNLRKHLINNNIYCPVHWPKPDMLSGKNKTNLYHKGLSLIIDQRYDSIHMQHLVRRIEQFYE